MFPLELKVPLKLKINRAESYNNYIVIVWSESF